MQSTIHHQSDKTTSFSTKTHLPKVFRQFFVNKEFMENLSATVVLFGVKTSKTQHKNDNCESKTIQDTAIHCTHTQESQAAQQVICLFLFKTSVAGIFGLRRFLVFQQLFHVTTLGSTLETSASQLQSIKIAIDFLATKQREMRKGNKSSKAFPASFSWMLQV